MEKFEKEFVQRTGVRIIVGKGGMKQNTEEACRKYGALHCVFPAGCAVIAATIGEAGICGWIRTTKDRKREHDWERADRKEDNNSEMEEMNDES